MNNIQIFCDFDGTVSKIDTLNNFLHIYGDKEWLEIEKQWEQGLIGSRECLSKQMKVVSDMSEQKLDEFLNRVEIDEHFCKFLNLIRKNHIDFYIVSDGFDYFINKILENNGIKDIKVFANKLTLSHGKFITEFPYNEKKCSTSAGVCKCEIIKKYKKGTRSGFYIGDVVSDFCASKMADFLFAKGRLLEYCKKDKYSGKYPNLIGFCDFNDIICYLKKYLRNN